MEQILETTDNALGNGKGKALVSLILGLTGVVAWLIPIIGAPVTIVGLVMGILGRKSSRKKMAVAGIILCSIFLAASIVNGVLGAMIAIKAINETLK